jgi:hypothetical protein
MLIVSRSLQASKMNAKALQAEKDKEKETESSVIGQMMDGTAVVNEAIDVIHKGEEKRKSRQRVCPFFLQGII